MSIPNIRRSVLIAAGVGALAVSALFAGRLLAGQTERHGPRAGATAPRLFARISRHLELTADQQARIRAVLKDHAAEIEAQVRAGRDARRALHEAVLRESPDEAAVRGLAQQLGNAHADGALLFAKIRAEASPILTAEQQTKLQEFRARRRHRGDASLEELQDWLRGEN